MIYNISKPSDFLTQYVKYYWFMESFIPAGKEHIQRIVPNGLFELIIYLKDKPKSTDDNKSVSDNVLLTGQLKGFHDLKIKGNLTLFAVYFYPHGLSRFLNIPLSEIYNHSVPLNLIIKDKVSRLEDGLSSAMSFENMVVIAEKFLFNQIKKSEENYKSERITHIISLINNSKGNLSIEELASQSFLSRKQLERVFAESIGTSPKQFLRIVRFQNAIFEKSQHPEFNVTDIAYKCGYFDQSHMINDFKKLSGLTPKNFLDNEDLFSDYFG